MNPETTLAEALPRNIVQKEGGNVAVTALLPEEMTGCQSALIACMERKIAEHQADAEELRLAAEHAREQKWSTKTLLSHHAKAEKRAIFYRKIKLALEAGYVIVPNFPVSMFAIRTSREKPLALLSTNYWSNHEQVATAMPALEGEYKNPFPTQYQRTVPAPTSQDPTRTTKEYWAEEWNELEFPIAMAKPQIMEATTRAMALSIFDQFGILPSEVKQDPIIVAQMVDPRSTRYRRRLVTFMIAWHLDTRVL